MIRALYSAASGMNAQQMNVDNIANNLANVNTTGFKRGRVDFQDLIYQAVKPAGANASVYAHNRSGGITSAFGKASRGEGGHTLKVEVHRGGAPIHVDNVNGGIFICSPAEAGGNV